MERRRPGDRIGGGVVRVGDLDARAPDHEAHVWLPIGGAGVERQPRLAGEQSGKHGRQRRASEERHDCAVVVAKVGQKRWITAALRGFHQRARGHRSLRQKTAIIEEGSQFAALLVHERIAKALINPAERYAHELARVGDELPVAEMHAANDARAAADNLFELLLRLEPDALLGGDRPETERFAERSAEVFPHGPGDPLALGLRKFGISERQIPERALLPVESRGDEPPGQARTPRHGFERQRSRGRLSCPEYDIFQAVTQGFRENHHSTKDWPCGQGPLIATTLEASVKRTCREGPI